MDVHKLADDTASVAIDWAEVKPGVSWHPAPALIDGAVTIASSHWEGTLQTVTFAGGVPGRATQVVLRADPNGNHHHRRASSVVVHVIHDWRWLAPFFVRAEAPRLAELIEGADAMAAECHRRRGRRCLEMCGRARRRARGAVGRGSGIARGGKRAV